MNLIDMIDFADALRDHAANVKSYPSLAHRSALRLVQTWRSVRRKVDRCPPGEVELFDSYTRRADLAIVEGYTPTDAERYHIDELATRAAVPLADLLVVQFHAERPKLPHELTPATDDREFGSVAIPEPAPTSSAVEDADTAELPSGVVTGDGTGARLPDAQIDPDGVCRSGGVAPAIAPLEDDGPLPPEARGSTPSC